MDACGIDEAIPGSCLLVKRIHSCSTMNQFTWRLLAVSPEPYLKLVRWQADLIGRILPSQFAFSPLTVSLFQKISVALSRFWASTPLTLKVTEALVDAQTVNLGFLLLIASPGFMPDSPPSYLSLGSQASSADLHSRPVLQTKPTVLWASVVVKSGTRPSSQRQERAGGVCTCPTGTQRFFSTLDFMKFVEMIESLIGSQAAHRQCLVCRTLLVLYQLCHFQKHWWLFHSWY